LKNRGLDISCLSGIFYHKSAKIASLICKKNARYNPVISKVLIGNSVIYGCFIGQNYIATERSTHQTDISPTDNYDSLMCVYETV
ncbi:MAG: hypothetical protein IKU55_02130, partial [Clostridia bacterium]|nr:hypothetical protein [Clostridia bacterium]